MLIIYRGCIMIKDKKGIISVSVIYSFFLIFCLLLILIMTTYTNNRVNFKLLKNDIKKVFITKKPVNKVTLKSKIDSYSKTPLADDLSTTVSEYLKNESSDKNYISFGVIKNDTIHDNVGKKMIWRIIRINGDGSIRLIYNESIGSASFNNENNDAVYTGYMFSPNVRNGLSTNSNVKGIIDDWYEANLKDTVYEQYISPSIFCVNRNAYTTPSRAASAFGFGTDEQYFEDHTRLENFKCDSNFDRFDTRINYEGLTESDSPKGNGALTYMIGLLTATEASKISTTVRGNTRTWTLSPSHYNSGAYVYYASSFLESKDVKEVGDIRPVISIKADTPIIHDTDGTSGNPFVVATNQGDFGNGGVCS